MGRDYTPGLYEAALKAGAVYVSGRAQAKARRAARLAKVEQAR